MLKDVDDYLQVAPTTEAMHGPWTYYRFFGASRDISGRARQAIHDSPAAPRTWSPGTIGNWQSQHPPLYYLAMVPAYLLSKSWSLAAQLFFLRSVSYLIAWTALCLAIAAALRGLAHSGTPSRMLPLGIAAWPLLFPMWFPEMARLGNDSLVTVFAATTL